MGSQLHCRPRPRRAPDASASSFTSLSSLALNIFKSTSLVVPLSSLPGHVGRPEHGVLAEIQCTVSRPTRVKRGRDRHCICTDSRTLFVSRVRSTTSASWGCSWPVRAGTTRLRARGCVLFRGRARAACSRAHLQVLDLLEIARQTVGRAQGLPTNQPFDFSGVTTDTAQTPLVASYRRLVAAVAQHHAYYSEPDLQGVFWSRHDVQGLT
jgi:hypothetical protein